MNFDDPFAEFRRLHEYMEEMRRKFLGSPGQPQFCPNVLEPAVDVCETDDSVIVLAEMPGIKLETLHISVEGQTLTMRGEKEDRCSKRPGRLYTQMEICCGLFERTVDLPAQVDAERAEAVYQDGFLEIVLPKVKRPTEHRVRIVIK